MASQEMKPETKKTEQKQSPQVKDLTPPPPALPYKTCNLKVSIHCEGCKRKVKKILTSIEGVYRVDIDVKQNNVTVMGIVSPEILLKKLHKAGKNADLLPEIPDPVEIKPVEQKENKPVDQKKKNKKKKEEKPEITDKITPSGSDKPESEKPGDSSEASVPVKEEKCESLKKKDSAPADSSPPSTEDSPASAESPAPTVEKKPEESSGSVGKKKKKKAQSMSSVNNPTTGGPGRTRSLPSPTTTTTTPAAEDLDRSINQHDGHYQMPTNNIPPRQDMYHYPPNYYAPQIMYGVSYNVAQPPVSVDAASYYSPAPPHSFAYMHPGYLPSDQNPYPSRPSDSFELFSDENPNGCSVM